MDPEVALIGVMAVAWIASVAMLVMLWRQLRVTRELVEEQRTMMELAVMRSRLRQRSPEVDPDIVVEESLDVDGRRPAEAVELPDGGDGTMEALLSELDDRE